MTELNLQIVAERLEELGFETSMDEGVLLATREAGDEAIDMRIDGSGQCLVERNLRKEKESKTRVILGQETRVIGEEEENIKFRVRLPNVEVIEELVAVVEEDEEDW